MKLLSPPESFLSPNWSPGFWTILSLLYVGLMTTVVFFIQASLPSPMTLDDSVKIGDGSQRFIAARAQDYLNAIIKMGPRPVGSYENEVYTRDYLQKEIQKIRNESNPLQTITTADQVSSGAYYLDMKPVGYVSYHDNVQNIVVRLSPSGRKNASAVLINCHFDSVPGSPGASDDAFHCAVMLEILRVLSHSNQRLLHDIIFLFNGAEESVLQASHGFITQHDWAKNVKAFINLEGCGAGGKEILFQTGPKSPWLVQMYANNAPHPRGNVIGEELFQSGIIPSDTDFRIFRDFGNIPGFDFANIDNGFVYHTRFDNGHLVPPGSYQHTGDNILALAQALANSPDLDSVNSLGDSMVFYDFFGVWLICYTKMFGTVLNTIVILMSLCSILCLLLRKRIDACLSVTELASLFGVALSAILVGWILAILYIYLLTMFLNWMNLTQSWYRSFFYQCSLYYCSTVLFCVLGPFLIFKQRSKLSPLQKAEMNSLSSQFIWTIILLVGTIYGIRSSYLPLIFVFCPTLSNLILVLTKKYSAKTWLVIQLVQSVIPMMIAIANTFMAMSSLVPITNRSGSSLNVELAIGILSAATCIMIIFNLVPLSIFLRHVSVITVLASAHLIGIVALLAFQPFPFYEWQTGESGVLQRVPLWHVGRTLHDHQGNPRLSDSGYWMMNMDRSSPHFLKSVVTELNSARTASDFCGIELFCALPLYSPRLSNFVNGSLWIPGPKPFEADIFNMSTKVVEVEPSLSRVTFTISGPKQMSFMFSPVHGVNVKSWSLGAKLIAPSTYKERPAYFIFYQRGLDGPAWEFHIDFEIKNRPQDENLEKLATVALAGSHIHPDHFSKEFKNFIDKFPRWAFVSPRSSEIKIWEI